MKNLKLPIAGIVMAVMITSTALADDSVIANIARDYSEANWVLISLTGQPYQPESRLIEKISSSYFDANWLVFHGTDNSLRALANTQTYIFILSEQGDN